MHRFYLYPLLLLLLAGSANAQETWKPSFARSWSDIFGNSQIRAVTYKFVPVKEKADRNHFLSGHSPQLAEVILKLNRIDLESLHRLDTLVVPEPLDTAFLRYSPFPVQLPWAQQVSKLLLFSYRIQAFAAYKNGQLVRWGPTSMGKEETPTTRGLFSANWKKKFHISTIDPEWEMPWTVNIECECGIALHQYSLPGYPASHQCLRLHQTDARWLFHWIDTWLTDKNNNRLAHGTAVIVFGSYDFRKKGPWRQLPLNPYATTITLQELEQHVLPYMDQVKERDQERQLVLEKKRQK